MESFAARLSANLEELQNKSRQKREIPFPNTELPVMEATVFAEEAEEFSGTESFVNSVVEIPAEQEIYSEEEKQFVENLSIEQEKPAKENPAEENLNENRTEEKYAKETPLKETAAPKKVSKPVRPKVMSSRGIGGKVQRTEAESRKPVQSRTQKTSEKAEPAEQVRKVSPQNSQTVRVRSGKVQKGPTEANAVRRPVQNPEKQPKRKAANSQPAFKVSERFKSAGKLGDDSLRISSLYKSFGAKTVVRGVDFSMHTGEVVGLLGPNGAGKTTTFYMIVGFYRPTSGDVFLNEKRVTRMPMYRRAREGISYLPQEPSVFKKLTVEQNIWAILETRRDLTKAQKLRKLDQLIDEFSIGHIRKQLAYSLSGGERRRTEIARSLAIEPKFLLLDEPFAGIDPIAVADIKSIVRLLANRGIGVLITDHNVRDTLEITDRAIIISSGQIAASGNKEEILQNETARKIYLGEEFRM